MMKQKKILMEDWEKYREKKIINILKNQNHNNKIWRIINDELYKICPKCKRWLKYDTKYYYKRKQWIDAKRTKKEGRLNSACKKCSVKLRSKQIKNDVNGKYSRYKYAAEKRNLEFKLDKNDCETLFRSQCFYCGYESDSLNGIDRIDSKKGYELHNVVPCCIACNIMKGSLETKKKMKLYNIDFIEHCVKIAVNHMESMGVPDEYKNIISQP